MAADLAGSAPGKVTGRILMAMIDVGGTVPPARGLAAGLVRRGHQVRVLADPTVAGGRSVCWLHVHVLADRAALRLTHRLDHADCRHGGP